MSIKQNKIHTVVFAALCFGMIVLLAYGTSIDAHDDIKFLLRLYRAGLSQSAFKCLCIIGCIFFSICEIYLVKEIFSTKIMIEICDEYFYDNSSAISVGKIAWTDMVSARMQDGFLVIALRNPEEYIARKGKISKLFIQGNLQLGYDVVCISTNRFKICESEFFEEFNKRMTIENL